MKSKLIKLSFEKDVKKLKNRIFLYKGILYKNTKFELENDINNSECQDVIDALNIKNKKNRIKFVYDKACDTIDKYNEKNKITCEFENGKCKVQNEYNSKYVNGCCRSCPLQSDKGCTSKNISCKLFYCDEICKKNKTIKIKDITILKCLSLRGRLMIYSYFFSRKEEIINSLYVNSLVWYALKQLINLGKIIKYKVNCKNDNVTK